MHTIALSKRPRTKRRSVYEKVRALLIDIDDTIIRIKKSWHEQNQTAAAGPDFFDVLRRAGVEIAGLSSAEAVRRIEKIRTEIRWWHWSDFICALELDAERFWRFALRVDSDHLEATGSEILPSLQRLRACGILLCVSSNNPNDGILHKLRLAGVISNDQPAPFHHLFGVAGLHAMKWEPIYWRRLLARLGLGGDQVMVVGDNIHDDYEVPLSVGIAGTFLIDRSGAQTAPHPRSLVYVRDFQQIVDHLTGAS